MSERTSALPSDPVLVVDDDPASRELTAVLLQRSGYAVRQAASAAEALELLADPDNHFCLLLTDMVMPNMGGEGLILELRNQYRGLPILAISGWSELSEGALSPEELGVDADIVFLPKPYNRTQLQRAVKQVLGPLSRPTRFEAPEACEE